MLRVFTKIKSGFVITPLILLSLILVVSSCESGEVSRISETAEKELQRDAEAKQTISQVAQILNSGRKLKYEEFEKIKAVYNKYPLAETAFQTYKSALISRQDWAAVEKLLTSLPPAELSREDRLNIGITYFKLGRYRDAITQLEPFKAEEGYNITSMLANSYFQTGDYDKAKALLDGNWEKITGDKQVADMNLRGMIYFHEKQPAKAIETFKKVLALEPLNVMAANGLSRVYNAQGETEKAEEYLVKVQKGFDRVTADEQKKTNYIAKLVQLEKAYKSKNFQEAIDISKQILPEADARNRVLILKYLYNSYSALGMTKEAQKIAAQARQMQSRK